jgi:chemotaxis protein MotB
MLNRLSIIVLCLVLFSILSCVSKSKYVELETELNKSQTQSVEDSKKMAVLQERNRILLDENRRLIEAVDDLKLELQQEKLAVQKKEREISELDKTRKEIESDLKEQIEQKDIKLEEIEGKLKVTFVDKILFDSGSVNIKPKGKKVLLKLTDSFRADKDQNIVVEGHTDDVQIGSALLGRFPTNWELSAARATAVTRFLQEEGNIEPERLTASGFSFYRPVADNETEEGRKQNRRIEIILLPKR